MADISPGTCECSVCHKIKDNTEFSFYKNRKTKDGSRLRVNTNCHDCQRKNKKITAELKKLHPPPAVGEKCMCCGRIVKEKRYWQCEHDHQTGEFRGYVCKWCNTGLGLIGDSQEAALHIIKYLLKSSKENDKTKKLLEAVDEFLKNG